MSQNKIKILAAAVVLAAYSSSSYAAQMTNQQIQALVDQVVAQKTQKLQHEVGQLKTEVVSLKQELKVSKKGSITSVRSRHHQHFGAVETITATSPKTGSGYNADQPRHPNYQHINTSAPTLVADNSALVRLYLGGTPVFSSPYIGVHSSYDGSDLIVNQSTVNFDTRLLKQQQALDDAIAKKGFSVSHRPIIEVSGEVAGVGTVTKHSPGSTNGDINLSDAELDIYAQVDPWVLGYLSFAWEDNLNSPYRVSNANASIDKAFVTIGNLSKTPFYASLGQLYVPFGQYNSYMISDSLPEDLARTKARAAVIGFHHQAENGPFGSVYVFKSDTIDNDKSADGGVNLGYTFGADNFSGTLAVGAISNIADSIGMQNTGAPNSIPFSGFGMSSMAENIFKAVPAVDVNGSLTYKHFNLLGEYVDTTTAFNPMALSFDGYGARPSTGQIEGAYTFHLHGKPGSFAIGYNWTQDALGLLLPKHRYIATVNYSFWRNTMESLEFRHDINYGANDTASGAGSSTFTPLNKYINMATLQIAVFF